MMYTMMYDMKKESGFTLPEIYEMYPFEMELFHDMCIKDIKDRIEAKSKSIR